MGWITDEEHEAKTIGKKYNQLTVQSLNRVDYRDIKNSKYKNKVRYYNCLCDCGNTSVVEYHALPITRSCGCIGRESRKMVDLSGQRFGNLVVKSLDRIETVTSKNGIEYDNTFYICKCDCGRESSVLRNSLTSGNTKSCGCLRINTLIAKCENLLGQVFSRLTVVSKKDGIGSFWNCVCDCGSTVTVKAGDLKSEATKSCGCLQKEKATIKVLQISRDYRISKGLDPDKPMLEERVLERARFKTLRKEIFERDSYTCACCSVVGSRLNVHHIETWAFAPELRFDKSNLVTLCVSCHKAVHKGNFNAPPDEITSILLMGYTKVIDSYQDEVVTYALL